MAAWMIPALKAVLPHVATIDAAAAPAFTRRSAEATATQALVQQQVAELQAAASQNASHIRELAAQLQTTLATLEQAALDAEARLRGLRRLCLAALATAATSLALAVFLLLGD